MSKKLWFEQLDRLLKEVRHCIISWSVVDIRYRSSGLALAKKQIHQQISQLHRCNYGLGLQLEFPCASTVGSWSYAVPVDRTGTSPLDWLHLFLQHFSIEWLQWQRQLGLCELVLFKVEIQPLSMQLQLHLKRRPPSIINQAAVGIKGILLWISLVPFCGVLQ